MLTTIAFVACVNAACFPYHVLIPLYGNIYQEIQPTPTKEWCKEMAPIHLEVGPYGQDRYKQGMLSDVYKLGLPNVSFVPETIMCWPVQHSAQ